MSRLSTLWGKITDLWGRFGDWVDGKKTHLANLCTFATIAYLWKKGVVPAAEAFGLAATTALSSLARMFTKTPGPFAPKPPDPPK